MNQPPLIHARHVHTYTPTHTRNLVLNVCKFKWQKALTRSGRINTQCVLSRGLQYFGRRNPCVYCNSTAGTKQRAPALFDSRGWFLTRSWPQTIFALLNYESTNKLMSISRSHNKKSWRKHRKKTTLSRESHPESVCQHFRPSEVGVRRNADKELPPREEDVAALQSGPSEVGLLGVHLHHCQLQLGHHSLHRFHLQKWRENTCLEFYSLKKNQKSIQIHSSAIWVRHISYKRHISVPFKDSLVMEQELQLVAEQLQLRTGNYYN